MEEFSQGYHRSYVNEDYVDSVVQNGGVPYIIPFTENDEVIREQLNHVQGLILSGGHDVIHVFMAKNQCKRLVLLGLNAIILIWRLLKLAEENGIPVLGICRGAQIINVAHGGTLYPRSFIQKRTYFETHARSYANFAYS